MDKVILEISDQVNCRFVGLDAALRRKVCEKLKFFVPYARHMPAFKLGRWDGKVSFATVGGATYLNLLDRVLPIVMDAGLDIEINDKRPTFAFNFPEVSEDMLADTCWPEGHPMAGQPIMLRDYQVEAVKRYLDNPQSIQSISTGAGKSQPLWSKIKTPSGWTTMGEIKPGDTVSTPDGGTARVVSIHPQGEIDYYRLTFKDGRTAEACGEHLWEIYNVDRKQKMIDGVMTKTGNPWSLMTTNEITQQMGKSKRPLRIALTEAQGTHTDLPIEPYALGALIGDGSIIKSLGISSADAYVIERMASSLPDYELKYRGRYDYTIKQKTFSKKCRLRASLRELGLLGTRSHDKFIPYQYKHASKAQKLALLQGLMDTDGYVGKTGYIVFTSVSKTLASDVAEVVRSIGGLARIRSKETSYTYKGERKQGKTAYNVWVRYPNPGDILSLPRKLDRIPKEYQYKNDLKLEIVKIERMGSTECQCILIDHPRHLYVTDNYVVTHNTLLTATLSKLCEPFGRTIVIVPSKSLVEQTEEDYRNLGLDVGVFYGDRKEWDRTHTICTWQSLTTFAKKGRREDLELNIMDFLKGVVTVMVDEVHSAKANELKELLCGPMAHIPIRWGLTGTVPKEEFEFLSLLASLGPVVGEIRAADLQEKGVLANCHVEVVQLRDDHVEFRTYPEEYDFLVTDPQRLAFIGEYCKALAEQGNTMILVDRIETGKILADLIPDSVFVSGSTKSKDRKKEYKEVQQAQGKVIIATYGVAAVGINIPRIFNLVLVEAGKSFVRVIQSIGRGIRKAQDKDAVHIVDMCSTAKFSARHLAKRKVFYKEADYPFSITKLDYR